MEEHQGSRAGKNISSSRWRVILSSSRDVAIVFTTSHKLWLSAQDLFKIKATKWGIDRADGF